MPRGEEDRAQGSTSLSLQHEDLMLALASWHKVVELVPTWHEVFFVELFEKNRSAAHLYQDKDGTPWSQRHRDRVGRAVEDVIKSLKDYDYVVSKLLVSIVSFSFLYLFVVPFCCPYSVWH